MNEIPNPISLAREMYVVEWTLQLPYTISMIAEDISGKIDISQEGGNNVSEIEALNKINLTQKIHIESVRTSNKNYDS